MLELWEALGFWRYVLIAYCCTCWIGAGVQMARIGRTPE